MTVARSASAVVRNPVLGLPAAAQLQALDPECKAALAGILADIATQADVKAEDAWRRRKGPMAAYWRAVATYAKHTSRTLRKEPARYNV